MYTLKFSTEQFENTNFMTPIEGDQFTISVNGDEEAVKGFLYGCAYNLSIPVNSSISEELSQKSMYVLNDIEEEKYFLENVDNYEAVCSRNGDLYETAYLTNDPSKFAYGYHLARGLTCVFKIYSLDDGADCNLYLIHKNKNHDFKFNGGINFFQNREVIKNIHGNLTVQIKM